MLNVEIQLARATSFKCVVPTMWHSSWFSPAIRTLLTREIQIKTRRDHVVGSCPCLAGGFTLQMKEAKSKCFQNLRKCLQSKRFNAMVHWMTFIRWGYSRKQRGWSASSFWFSSYISRISVEEIELLVVVVSSLKLDNSMRNKKHKPERRGSIYLYQPFL